MRLGDLRTPSQQHHSGMPDGGVRFSFKGDQMRETGQFSSEANLARKQQQIASEQDENVDPNMG